MNITINKRKQSIAFLSLVVAISGLGGCAVDSDAGQLTDMQSIALCRSDQQAQETEKRITAEYGFKSFAKIAYRPMLDQSLFGHKIRVVELSAERNKLYAAGNPREFGHHFGLIIKDVSCDRKSCQAPINAEQTLHIYSVHLKKAKDTSVIECTKKPKEE